MTKEKMIEELNKFQKKHKQFFDKNKISIFEYFNVASYPFSYVHSVQKKFPFDEEMMSEFNEIITRTY